MDAMGFFCRNDVRLGLTNVSRLGGHLKNIKGVGESD